MGGRYIQGEIADIERNDGKIKAVITKDKQHIAKKSSANSFI